MQKYWLMVRQVADMYTNSIYTICKRVAIKSPQQKQSKLSSLYRSWQKFYGKATWRWWYTGNLQIHERKFFPELLEDLTLPTEEKEKIKGLLAKPFNPYIRHHSALTEKSTKLKSSILNQHAGWTTNSGMAQKYIHYFGNESSESLLEAYGIVNKNNIPIDTLNPKICPNCNEGNTQDAKFCSGCKMIMSFDGYQGATGTAREGQRFTISQRAYGEYRERSS